jgi:hypothetical protein
MLTYRAGIYESGESYSQADLNLFFKNFAPFIPNSMSSVLTVSDFFADILVKTLSLSCSLSMVALGLSPKHSPVGRLCWTLPSPSMFAYVHSWTLQADKLVVPSPTLSRWSSSLSTILTGYNTAMVFLTHYWTPGMG